MSTNIKLRSCLVLLYTLCSVTKSGYVLSQVMSSLSDMEPLLSTHKNIIDSLHDYIIKEKKRHNVLETYLNDYRKEHVQAMTDVPRYVESPFGAFTLIKRLTVDLEFVERTINTRSPYYKNPRMRYPLVEDLSGAAEALMGLRDTYRLNITELADGVLNGDFSHENTAYTESVIPMSVSDCFALGLILYRVQDFNNGLLWLLEAYNKIPTEEHDGLDMVDLIAYIISGYRMIDDVANALKWMKMFASLKHSDIFANMMKEYEQRLAKENKEKERNVDTKKMDVKRMELILPIDRTQEIYEAACRGEIEVPRQIGQRLKCRYLTENHPFLKLAPIKMEQIYIKPEVLLFHEVISDQEIEQIKTLAKPKLKRVEVSENEPSPGWHRLNSKSVWLKDQDFEVVARVSRRISHLTGLSTESADDLQVTNYGIGGYYDIENKTSMRMATVLFYLSEVSQGGATVFPWLGLSVFPARGAALFWRNLLPSEEGHPGTLHAACPVLRGDKWVSHKSIHQCGEELRRPCNREYQKESKHKILRPVAKSLAC